MSARACNSKADISSTVLHALSASGARYANPDESLVFWNKGNTAFLEARGQTTIAGCVAK